MHASRTRGEPIFITSARSACLRLLLVEDNEVLQLAARELLESTWELELHTASDGEEAVRACADVEYDLVLMDLEMPVMDGFEATRRLRRLEAGDPARRRAAVVAYTSVNADLIRSELEGCGIDAVLAKPAPPAALCACLHRWAAGKVHRRPGADCHGSPLPPRSFDQ